MFFMQFNHILHQMHRGERAGLMLVLSNNKSSKRKAQTGLPHLPEPHSPHVSLPNSHSHQPKHKSLQHSQKAAFQ